MGGLSYGAGAMYGDGGDTGERILASVLASAHAWLQKGTGRLTAVATVPNVEELPTRMQSWLNLRVNKDEKSSLKTTILHGQAQKCDESSLIPGQGEAPLMDQYYASLRKLGITTVAEVLILAKASATGETEDAICSSLQQNLWV